MRTPATVDDGPRVPLWIRRPAALHLGAYVLAGLIFAAQIITALAIGSELPTILAVLLAGGGVALSWWRPWAGLVVTSAASLAVTALGDDPVSVWMMAVLVLFSFTFRGKPPVPGTAVVAAFFFAGLWMGHGFGSGSLVSAAALFTAIGGGATGAALRLSRDHWLVSEERARTAVATREMEVERRVTEERLRIARDLHDVVGHQVAMLSVHLGVAEIGLPEQATSSRQALESARSNARNVVSETQRILSLLRRGDTIPHDDALRPTPSLGSLDGLIASFGSIGLDVSASISLDDPEGEPSVGVTVYRIVQEALTNAYRHGEGAATVDIHESDGRIHVTVSNRIGHALRGAVAGSGLGLVGMRERVESCGGRLTIVTADGQFRVSAELSPIGAQLA
ncbi:sensor histidine kinase [Glaciihabitans sp. dw_435]|uniref:sensor histidine kinase n=1 Tax=Glaciihabitans sp. dw_435 TaxID=2720081 RepID=UPI001BD5D65F|nr:histidine kinase [Glaciihabitans sp. dw_435]